MSVIINFKICDNSEDCNGIAVCPTKAFYWDAKRKTIAVDDSKCISCGLCEKSCPVNAIRVAKNQKAYEKIKREIDKDPRTISDLFIDRYGAQPISAAFSIPQTDFDVQILKSTKLAVVELFKRDSIKCLLYSIPIKNLFRGADIKYRKINACDNSLLQSFNVQKLPALLFFKAGKLVGKIEGYYDLDREAELTQEVSKIMSKVK